MCDTSRHIMITCTSKQKKNGVWRENSNNYRNGEEQPNTKVGKWLII